MNKATYRFSLDVNKTNSQILLQTKKASTGRTMQVTLFESVLPYKIAEDCYAVFRAEKPDGTVIFNDCVIKDNKIIYDITLQTVSSVGLVQCEITLYDVNGKQLTSPHFELLVEETTQNDDDIESSDEFSALTNIIGKLGNIDYLIKLQVEKTLQEALLNGGEIPDVKDLYRRRLVDVPLTAARWIGSASPWTQRVDIEGITEKSQLNLTLDTEQYNDFYSENIGILTENESGKITVYAYGNKPSKDYVLQGYIEEVAV